MRHLTTTNAADRLGVTPRRVRQMLLAGQLRGQRHGRDWIIPEDAIDTIARPKRGRPANETTQTDRID